MSNQIRPLLSLVIPAYNEAERLPATLQRLQEHRRSWNFSSEIIIVVEPGEDGTVVVLPVFSGLVGHSREGTRRPKSARVARASGVAGSRCSDFRKT